MPKTFTYTQGGALPPVQPYSVECVDCETRLIPSGPIQATIQTNAAWLTLDRLSGTTPFTSKASVNPVGLVAGTYNAAISIASTSQVICNPNDSEVITLQILAAPVDVGAVRVLDSATLRIQAAVDVADVDITLKPGGVLKNWRITRRKLDKDPDLLVTVNRSTVVYINGVKQ